MYRLATIIAAIVLALLAAAPASADTGRIAFPVGLPAPAPNVDVTGATAAVARRGGGAVLVGDEPGRGFVAAAIDSDGALDDAAFGLGGVSHVRVGTDRFRTLSVHARPDGRLLVVGTLASADPFESPQLTVVGLTPRGELDVSFGDGGIARSGVQASCGGCDPAALASDGSLVMTGTTGSVSPEIAHDPDAPNSFTWVVARLTLAGRPDTAFGVRPVPGTTPGGGRGEGAAITPDGRITLLGGKGSRSMATRLLANGSADPSFAGGGIATVPSRFAVNLVVGDDGTVTARGAGSVSRLRPDGSVDAAFGDGGTVRVRDGFARLLGIGGGQVLVYTASFQAQPAAEPALIVDRLDATGRRTTTRLHLPFGGGVASVYRYRAPRPVPPLDQNAFRVAALLPRPGGGYLAAGDVTIQQYASEGEGWSTARFAAAALTPGLELDHAFGPNRAGVKAAVSLVRQGARSAVRLRGVAVRIRASQPGLARISVRDRRGRTLAFGIEPLYRPGTSRVRVPLTRLGQRMLRHTGQRVRLSARFRDVLAAEVTAARGVSGTLR